MGPAYGLSSGQKQAWIEQLPSPRRGIQTKIAEELVRKRHGTLGSWKTNLTGFFHGEEKGLKSVFDHPDRLAIVAAVLGVSASAMTGWLDTARGVPTADEPGTARIPGFEDRGAFPIWDIFFPPRLRQARFLLARHGDLHSAGGGKLDLDKLVAAATVSLDPPVAKAIVIAGEPGSGRTPTLQALAARLRDAGLDVSTWEQSQEAYYPVLLVDHLDELDPGVRGKVLAHVLARGLTLLCSVSPGSSIADLPAEQVVVDLGSGDEHWARAFLEHLDARVGAVLDRKIDTAPLREWIASAPDATSFLDSADVLGLAARHVADGGKVPVPLDQLLSLAVGRWASLVRREGHGAEALVIELCLGPALATLAAAACRRGGWSHGLGDVAAALVREAGAQLAGDSGGTWRELGAPGMLSVVDGLLRRGALVRRGDRVEPAQRILQSVALGAALTRSLGDAELLGNAVADPRWHEGVVTCAALLGDSAPVLRALEDLPLDVRVHGYAVATRLLAAEMPCADVGVLNRWFRRCLRWWAATPPESRATSVTVGGPSTPEPSAPAEALIGGTSPLLVLARASRRHRKALEGPRTAQDLLDGPDLPLDERRFLEALGRAPTQLSIEDALLVGAPFQCDAILDPASWERFPSGRRHSHDLPAGLTREECATWWRTAGTERLRLEPEGAARIAGAVQGWTVTWGMTQPFESGCRIWADALFESLRGQGEGAPGAFTEAVAFLVRSGASANFYALKSLWSKLGSAERGPLRPLVAERLPEPDEWFLDEQWLGWVLGELLTPEARVDAWTRWISNTGRTVWRIPWRAFMVGGLPLTTIATWAVETVAERPRASGPSTSRLAVTGAGVALQLHDSEDAPQAAALDHLVGTDRADVLEVMLDAPHPWDMKALRRLGAVAPARARRVRLELAAEADDGLRNILLGEMAPERGEVELWQALATSAPSWHERFVRFVQASCASTGDDRWAAAEEVVALLEGVVLDHDGAGTRLRELLGPGDGTEGTFDVDTIVEELLEELHGNCAEVLADFGWILALAPEPDDGLARLVDRVLHGSLRLHACGGGIWQAAWKTHGVGYVVDRLVAGHGDEPGGAATVTRLRDCSAGGVFDEVVRKLLLHEVLGRAATRVFAERVAPQHVDLMVAALEGQPLVDGEGRPDPATAALVRKLASIDASAALGWAESTLPCIDSALARVWWELLLPALPSGAARRRAVTAWVGAV